MPRPSKGLIVVQKYTFYFLFVIKFPCMSERTPKLLTFLWECISWLSVFLPLHMALCVWKTVFDRLWLDDSVTLINIAVESVWFFFSFLGMVHYKRREKDFVTLIDAVEETCKWRSPKGRTYVDLERIYKLSKYFALFWQIFPALSVTYSITIPLFKSPMELPARFWYPFNTEKPLQFAMAYFFQVWANMVMVLNFTSGSSFYISVIFLCCGQFNILRCALKNLVYTSGVYHRFPDARLQHMHDNLREDDVFYMLANEMQDTLLSSMNHDPTQQTDSTLTAEEIKRFEAAIKSCIVHHLGILRLCAMLEDLLNVFVFYRVFEMILQICICSFLFVKVNSNIFLAYMLLACVDVFLLTYPSEFIQWQNESVAVSLMLGPWYLVSRHFHKDFSIIIANSTRPILFTAFKVYKCSSDLFRSVIMTAFSYYTLLKNVT